MAVLLEGQPGEIYNIGADAELENIAVVELILETLGKPRDLICYVTDRLGHRPAVCDRICKNPDPSSAGGLSTRRAKGIRETVQWVSRKS